MKYQETGIPGFERPRFFHGQLLTLEDFELLLQYPREKLRLLNRFIHGAGIVTGLWPELVRIDSQTCRLAVRLTPGMAITPGGEELVVTKPLSHGFEGHFCDGVYYLYLVYRERVKNKVPGMRADAEPDENVACDYSRVLEGYGLELSDRAPIQPKRLIQAELLRRHLADRPSAVELQRRLGLGDDFLDQLESDPRVFIGAVRFHRGHAELDAQTTIDHRATHLSYLQLESLLLHHVSEAENPHGVTAAQVGAIRSIQEIGPATSGPEGADIRLESPNDSLRIRTEGCHLQLEIRPGKRVRDVGEKPDPGFSHRFAREDHVHALAPNSVHGPHFDLEACFTSSDGSIRFSEGDGPIDLVAVMPEVGKPYRALSGWCSVRAPGLGFGESLWIQHDFGPKAVAIQTALEHFGEEGNAIHFGDLEAFPKNRILPGLSNAANLGAVLDVRNQRFKISIKNNSLRARHFTVRWWVFDCEPVEAGDKTRENWSGSGVDY